MPVAEASVKRNPIPEGNHLLTLISVEAKDQPSFNNPAVMETRWIWQFKSKMKDEETGERFEFRYYTGTRYGNSKAGLTILLDQMFPKLSEEDKGSIDTDDYLNTQYKARIRYEKPEKLTDPPKPRLVFIEPFKAKAAEEEKPAPKAAAKPAEVDPEYDPEDDVFADE